jgi:hypothetical protein
LLGRQLRFLAFQSLKVEAHHGDLDRLGVDIYTEQVVSEYSRLADYGQPGLAGFVFGQLRKQWVYPSFCRMFGEVPDVKSIRY